MPIMGRMDDADTPEQGLMERISQRGEEALGEFAQSLLENPVFSQALQAAFGAREKAVHAQQSAMEALNLPSAAEIDRLSRRLRSVSDRLEGIEDAVDRIETRLAGQDPAG